MEYILKVLLLFIGMLLITHILLFELSRKKAKDNNNLKWFLALDKSFSYNRVGYMFFLCIICYTLAGGESLLTLNGFLYFVLFLAMGIVADIVVQYVALIYSKKRCKKEIELAKRLLENVDTFMNDLHEDFGYTMTENQYHEKDILEKYIEPTSHLAYLCMDSGKIARENELFPEATFVVHPYGDIEKVKEELSDLPLQVTRLTPSHQMPFKDERMDVVMCHYANYEKEEIKRVLKKDGYFVVNQYGTANFNELLQLYVPFKIKGQWDAPSCVQTLQEANMQVLEDYEEYGKVRFSNLNQVYTYFKEYSADFSNVEKYKLFYTDVLKEIELNGFYELTTHRFLVVAKKV